jgi:hypothetical protein
MKATKLIEVLSSLIAKYPEKDLTVTIDTDGEVEDCDTVIYVEEFVDIRLTSVNSSSYYPKTCIVYSE